MPFLLIIVALISSVALMSFVVLLVAPYVGWSYIYDASVSKTMVEIPKSRKYSISVRRRSGFIRGLPKADFWITKEDTSKAIPYTSAFSLMRSRNGRIVTTRVGFFDAPSHGKYLIESKPESQFVEKDVIVIRKYISAAKQVLYIIGICISGLVFVQGLVLLLERV